MMETSCLKKDSPGTNWTKWLRRKTAKPAQDVLPLLPKSLLRTRDLRVRANLAVID
jgi:hypothetical protein